MLNGGDEGHLNRQTCARCMSINCANCVNKFLLLLLLLFLLSLRWRSAMVRWGVKHPSPCSQYASLALLLLGFLRSSTSLPCQPEPRTALSVSAPLPSSGQYLESSERQCPLYVGCPRANLWPNSGRRHKQPPLLAKSNEILCLRNALHRVFRCRW